MNPRVNGVRWRESLEHPEGNRGNLRVYSAWFEFEGAWFGCKDSEMTDRDWSVQGESREDLNVHRWELWCSEVWVREQRGAMSIEKGMEAN